MKKLMIGAVCAMMAAVTFAEPSVEITEAYQEVPGSGIVNYTYTVKDLGGLTYDLYIKVGAKGCDKTVVLTNESVTAGTVTASVNAKELLGKAYPNVTLFAELKMPECVQLWANGPYFAQCNVGATRPESAGYYFWWGDTVGYNWNYVNQAWESVDNGTQIGFDYAAPANSTYNMNKTDLKNAGWIDGSGNLVAAHDAATAHLGAPWRMPKEAELQKLADTSICKHEWKTNFNGTSVNGFLFTGVTIGYTGKSIFLPAPGYAYNGKLNLYGSQGGYWSSTPYSSTSTKDSVYFYFNSTSVSNGGGSRYQGHPVRPVRSTK